MLMPGPRRKLHAAGARVLTDRLAHLVGETGIPGGGERDAAGVGSVGTPGAHAFGAIAHLEHGEARGRLGADEHIVEAADEFEFLLEGQLRDHCVDALLDSGTVGNGGLSLQLAWQDTKNAAKNGGCDVKRLITHVDTSKSASTRLAEHHVFVKEEERGASYLFGEDEGP